MPPRRIPTPSATNGIWPPRSCSRARCTTAVADVNDRRRDADRLDLAESISLLGRGSAKFRVGEVPHYVELIRHVFERMEWNDGDFRGYRCRIDYPIYGSQVVMAFDPPPPPVRPAAAEADQGD